MTLISQATAMTGETTEVWSNDTDITGDGNDKKSTAVWSNDTDITGDGNNRRDNRGVE